jgi:hypothetical protein
LRSRFPLVSSFPDPYGGLLEVSGDAIPAIVAESHL